ncbi:MAG: hypothetical protein JJU06_10080 [Ectothiorhodospiraceae bacterium]|nr:hypothetical protein [Ectothiorhodospiraceae bacterium]
MTELRLKPQLQTIPIGFTQQFEVTAVFRDGTSRDVTDEAGWSTSVPEVAAVEDDTPGAVTGLAEGQTGVIASFWGETATAQIEVVEATLESVDISPADPLTLAINETAFLTATAVYDSGLSLDVTDSAIWTSGNDDQVSVDNEEFPGLVTGLEETADPVEIRAEFQGMNSAAVEISVTGVTLDSISLTAPASDIRQGTIVQFSAQATFDDESTSDVTDQVIWSAEPAEVLEIRNTPGFQGKAAAQQTGTARVTATMGERTDFVDVTVFADSVAPRRLNLTALPNVVVNGQNTTLRAEVSANDPDVTVEDSLVRFTLIGGDLDLGSNTEVETIDGVAEIEAQANAGSLDAPTLALVFAEIEGTLAQGFAWVMVVPGLADALLTTYAEEDGNYVFRAANQSNRPLELTGGQIGDGGTVSGPQIGMVLQTGDRLVIAVPKEPTGDQNGWGMDDPANRVVILSFRDQQSGELFDVTITADD